MVALISVHKYQSTVYEVNDFESQRGRREGHLNNFGETVENLMYAMSVLQTSGDVAIGAVWKRYFREKCVMTERETLQAVYQ